MLQVKKLKDENNPVCLVSLELVWPKLLECKHPTSNIKKQNRAFSISLHSNVFRTVSCTAGKYFTEDLCEQGFLVQQCLSPGCQLVMGK